MYIPVAYEQTGAKIAAYYLEKIQENSLRLPDGQTPPKLFRKERLLLKTLLYTSTENQLPTKQLIETLNTNRYRLLVILKNLDRKIGEAGWTIITVYNNQTQPGEFLHYLDLKPEVKQRKQEEFGQLYKRNYGLLHRRALYKVKNSAVAEDLVSDTFKNAWRAFSKYQPNSERAWLSTILNNLITGHYREIGKARLESINEENDDSPPLQLPSTDRYSDPAEVTEIKADIRKLLVALEKLPTIYREAVKLSYIDQLDHAEIAKSLGTSEGNIRVRVHRGLNLLRELMKDA